MKVAVVTGAARGIGLAISKKFLEEGYQIAILDIDQKTLLQTIKQDFDTNNVLGLECDVAEPDQVDPSVNRVLEQFGRIDVMVNNAGIAEFKPMLETSYEEWSRILAVNLNGPFICTQACAPFMLKNEGGSIVNIASISGLRAAGQWHTRAFQRKARLAGDINVNIIHRQQQGRCGDVLRIGVLIAELIHKCPTKGSALRADQGLRRQTFQRLSHRGTGHRKLFGKFGLRREAFIHDQSPFNNRIPYFGCDLSRKIRCVILCVFHLSDN